MKRKWTSDSIVDYEFMRAKPKIISLHNTSNKYKPLVAKIILAIAFSMLLFLVLRDS